MTPNEFYERTRKGSGDGASVGEGTTRKPEPVTPMGLTPLGHTPYIEMSKPKTHHGATWYKNKQRTGEEHRSMVPNKGKNRGREIPYVPRETN